MIALTPLPEQCRGGLRGDVRLGVAGVAVDHLNGLAQYAACVIDFLDAKVDTGNFGRAEERQRPRCRQERTNLERSFGGGGRGGNRAAGTWRQWWLPPLALGAGQAMPEAAGVVEPVELGVDEPPQAVARRATPMLSAVSLATRGAAWGSEII